MQLVFCYGKNPSFTPIALAAGFLYGAQLPCATYAPVWFADNEYRRPDKDAYIAALAEHRPAVATVLDWMRDEDLPEVLDWAERAAEYVRERLIVIPKVVSWDNPIRRIPRRIGGKDVVLGYSVPTSHGGTDVPLYQFKKWPIHLLGGSPHAQMRYARRFQAIADVVSVDGNMHCQQAQRCRFWRAEKGSKGHWVQLSEVGLGDYGEGSNLKAFELSCQNIAAAWGAPALDAAGEQ